MTAPPTNQALFGLVFFFFFVVPNPQTTLLIGDYFTLFITLLIGHFHFAHPLLISPFDFAHRGMNKVMNKAVLDEKSQKYPAAQFSFKTYSFWACRPSITTEIILPWRGAPGQCVFSSAVSEGHQESGNLRAQKAQSRFLSAAFFAFARASLRLQKPPGSKRSDLDFFMIHQD